MTDPSDDPEVSWLAPGQIKDWVSVMALVSTLPSALDAQLKRDAGLNLFEYHVLVHLDASPTGMVPMSDLALLAQGSVSRLSHAVGRLERAGLVRREACNEVGRRTGALLTAAGRAKLKSAAPGHVREVRRLVVDALEPGQLEALGEIARTVVAATSPEAAAAIERAPTP
ncbi:MarR family winged helix-turn-helix transcriptional regulator [Mumia zhuanghuii]|uniref:Winged helix-turn-helix transcriptional regulator n=1 Tax=Mumia zhuanghuii TaxID=2585211 RepID=A0A5C4N4A9_9ACTN|nr:MarR family winged helix-turn-helix transcriptional regulator [Mumia zhuanghuii]TNC51388.1 winged helix-turn-helix transcriptional regulator [Mumia zhuanghuii]